MAQASSEEETLDVHVKILKRKEFDITISRQAKVSEVFGKIAEHFPDPIDRLCFKGRFFRSPKDDAKEFLKGLNNKTSTIVGYPKKGVASNTNNNNNNNSTSSTSSNSTFSANTFSLFGPSSNNLNKNNNNNNNNNNSSSSSSSSNNNGKNSVDDAIARQKSLEEIQAAAMKLAQRANDGFNWDSQYYLELNDQHGNAIHMPDQTRQALTVALTLQQKAEKFLKNKEYQDALVLFQLAFESYSKVEQKWLDIVDNYGLCCLNIVWIFYLQKDEKHMNEAGQWLQIADIGLRRAYGENKERLIKSRQGGFTPELAFYVRLNILRAMQALYSGNLAKARNFLDLAKMDSRKLEISDAAIAHLSGMGFDFKEARRALRATQCNVDRAFDYIQKKRQERERRELEERERLRQRKEQKKYGLTKSGKFVDLKLLEQLEQMGISKVLAVECLKQCDNSQTALDIALDPHKKEVLESTIYSRAMRKQRKYEIDQLMELSPDKDEAKCRAALLLSWNVVQDAINILLQVPEREDLTKCWNKFLVPVAEKNERLERERKQREEEMMQRAMMESAAANANDGNETDGGDIDLTTGGAAAAAGAANANDASGANGNEDDKDVDMGGGGIDGMEDEKGGDKDNNNNNNNIVSNAIDMDEDVSAFPNPVLGDKGNENDNDNGNEMNLDNVEILDDFKDISYDNNENDNENQQIHEKILNDFEDDPNAYLDLDLNEELAAISSLETMIASMNATQMS